MTGASDKSDRAVAATPSSPQAVPPVPASIPSAGDFDAGFDLAVATLRSWGRGFFGGATANKWLYAAAGDLERNKRLIVAQAIEARSDETGTGSAVGESAVPEGMRP